MESFRIWRTGASSSVKERVGIVKQLAEIVKQLDRRGDEEELREGGRSVAMGQAWGEGGREHLDGWEGDLELSDSPGRPVASRGTRPAHLGIQRDEVQHDY